MTPPQSPMRHRLSSRLLPLGLLAGLLAAAPAAAQRKGGVLSQPAPERPVPTHGVLDISVTDSLDRPIDRAEIKVVGTKAAAFTDRRGRFRFTDVPPDTRLLVVVRRIGFRPVSGLVEVARGDTARIAYTLVASARTLDTIRVVERRRSLRMQEFEQRRRQGLGEFLDADFITKRASTATLDVLRFTKTVNVQVVSRDGSVLAEHIALSRREGGNPQYGACPMQIVVDNVPYPSATPLNLLPPPNEIAGIEIYGSGANAPLSFGGTDRRCGVIAIWTKDEL